MPPDAPSMTAAAPRRAPIDADARRAWAALAAALVLHLFGAGLLVTFAPPPSPPEPAPIPPAIVVELVIPPAPETEAPVAEPVPDASTEDAPAEDSFEPPSFDMNLGDYADVDILRMNDAADAGDPLAAPEVKGDVRRALARLARCRRLGARADDAEPCAPFAVAQASAEATDPRLFFDPAFIAAARVLERAAGAGASPLARGYDKRFSAADEMRDSLPPSAPDPYFGD